MPECQSASVSRLASSMAPETDDRTAGTDTAHGLATSVNRASSRTKVLKASSSASLFPYLLMYA
jgi:hypothetical protein